MSVTIQEIYDAVWQLKKSKAFELVTRGLQAGLDPVEMLQKGVIAGLRVVGDKFGAKEYFLAELVMGGKVAEPCIELIKPHLPPNAEGKQGTVVIGAVKGDLHTIGYGLVSTQLELAGFEVHKLGIDLDSKYFIQKAEEHHADIIGLSAFLVTTIPYCPEVIGYLQDMGLRDKYKVIIGGTECTADKADAMDADGWALNAVAAVPLCQQLMGKDVGEEARLATGYSHPWWYNARRS
ncbi:MAG: cobalamin B12-binding domain-containing protein [Deltaproteobacteria bacterium]|nr:cobalamin B12-binding domain-containing protein [Deltaproteobacteria bacterium]